MLLKKFQSFEGFTLVEVITAIGVISLILPIVFGIFFVILREQTRFIALKQEKAEGENLLYQIKNTIKNRAYKTCKRIPSSGNIDCTQTCSSGDDENNFIFQDPDGNFFRFFINSSNQVASEAGTLSSGTTSTSILTTSNVKVEKIGSTPFITCEIIDPNIFVNIYFKISFNSENASLEYTPSMIFKTKLRLNSY